MKIRSMTEEEFMKLSRKEKRMVVLRDVQLAVSLEVLRANQGNTFVVHKFSDERQQLMMVHRDNLPEDLKTFIDTFEPDDESRCEVCARGALLVGYVGYVNEFKMENVSEGFLRMDNLKPMDFKLYEIFDLEQMQLMEAYFEGRFIGVKEENYFYPEGSLLTPRLRLLRIIDNAIKHGGIFKPELEWE